MLKNASLKSNNNKIKNLPAPWGYAPSLRWPPAAENLPPESRDLTHTYCYKNVLIFLS